VKKVVLLGEKPAQEVINRVGYEKGRKHIDAVVEVSEKYNNRKEA
jgi:hypothetical protein